MGLSTTILGPFEGLVATQSPFLLITAGFGVILALAVVLNVLNQALFKNPNEPPVVFHWVPIIGSTISYGMEPFKFFFECREKVSSRDPVNICAGC